MSPNKNPRHPLPWHLNPQRHRTAIAMASASPSTPSVAASWSRATRATSTESAPTTGSGPSWARLGLAKKGTNHDIYHGYHGNIIRIKLYIYILYTYIYSQQYLIPVISYMAIGNPIEMEVLIEKSLNSLEWVFPAVWWPEGNIDWVWTFSFMRIIRINYPA